MECSLAEQMCLFTSLRKVTKIFFTLWNVHEVEERSLMFKNNLSLYEVKKMRIGGYFSTFNN